MNSTTLNGCRCIPARTARLMPRQPNTRSSHATPAGPSRKHPAGHRNASHAAGRLHRRAPKNPGNGIMNTSNAKERPATPQLRRPAPGSKTAARQQQVRKQRGLRRGCPASDPPLAQPQYRQARHRHPSGKKPPQAEKFRRGGVFPARFFFSSQARSRRRPGIRRGME